MLSNEELKTLISDWSEKISAELEKIETSESPEELCKWIQRTGIISMIKISALDTHVRYVTYHMCGPSVPSQLEYPNQSAQCESKDGRFVPIMFQDYNGHYSFEQLFKERTSAVIWVLSLVAMCVCVILISACYIYRNPSSNNNKRLKSKRLRKNKQLHKYLIRNNINTGSPTLGFSGGYVRSASFSMLSNDDFKTIDDRVLFNDDDNEPQPCSVSSQQFLQEKPEPKKKVKPEKPIRTSSLNKFKNI